MAYTTPAFVSMMKTITRRRWSPEYSYMFKKASVAKAWSKQPRHGGEPIGGLQIIKEPYQQNISDADPHEVYVQEGFEFLDKDDVLWEGTQRWCETGETFWVIEFRVIDVGAGIKARYTTPEHMEKARAACLKFLPPAPKA